MPITGTLRFRATSQTIRSASGLIAGPLSPPVMLPRIGRRRRQSIAMPTNVFTSETASAPASAAARAMATTSVTFGVSLAITGREQTPRTRRTIRPVTTGSVAKSRPPATLGQERFNSSPASPGSRPMRSAISTNSSWFFPAMLPMTAVGSVRKEGRCCSMK